MAKQTILRPTARGPGAGRPQERLEPEPELEARSFSQGKCCRLGVPQIGALSGSPYDKSPIIWGFYIRAPEPIVGGFPKQGLF